MPEFLLKKNVLALITIIIFCIIKLYIDFFVKTNDRRLSNSFFNSENNTISPNNNIGLYLKILNNFLTIMVLGIATAFLFVFDLSEKEPKTGGEIFITLDSAVYKAAEQRTAEVADVQFINTKPVEDKNAIENIKPVERSVIITKSVRKKTIKVYKKLANQTIDLKNEAPQKIEGKDLAIEEMDSILALVNTTRKELGIESKCVQVIKTRGSNVTNAFDLAKFFKKNGYIIAGRELKSDDVDGFKILVSGIIIKVTVGTFAVEPHKTD